MGRTSASFIKTGQSTLQSKPREGTKLRAAYDALMTGEPVDLKLYVKSQRASDIVNQLEGYGLEIRSKPNYSLPYTTRPRVFYTCIGIWDGMQFTSVEDIRKALGESNG